MPATLGSFVVSMAKNAVKEQIKRKGIEVMERTARLHFATKMNKGTATYFMSDRQLNMAIRGVNRAIRLPRNIRKLQTSRNLNQSYTKSKSLYNKMRYQFKDVKSAEKLRSFYQERNLNSLDREIFDFAQKEMSMIKKSPEGTFNIKDLTSDEEIREAIKKYVSFSERKDQQEEGFKMTRYDANYLYKHFDEETKELTREELKEKIYNKFTDQEEAEKEFNVLLKRLDKNIDAGYVDFE